MGRFAPVTAVGHEPLGSQPPTYDLLLRTYEPVKTGQGRLIDIIVVTRERIRQIEAKALRKPRHPSRSEQLRSVLED